MRNYNDENLLEMVELYAADNGYIADEDELSEKFDNEVLPCILEEHGKPGIEFDDTCMINEAFNNWSDMLCKDGEIHPQQYNDYCYVGKLSN
ncbi:hypothetical protein KAR91_51700 [Candidatus Pacearchaeota archaeon]|nr:hypothetical protein [Candidatus Pacearchaeota archaeon]